MRAFKAFSSILLSAGLIFHTASPAWPAAVKVGLSVKSAGAPASGLAVGIPGAAVLAPQTAAPAASLGGVLPSLALPGLNLPGQAVEAKAPLPALLEPADTQLRSPFSKRLRVMSAAAAKDGEALIKEEGPSASDSAGRSFARLAGESLIPASEDAGVFLPAGTPRLRPFQGRAAPLAASAQASEENSPPRPALPGPADTQQGGASGKLPRAALSKDGKKTVWTYLLGTGIFKIGMEALGLSAPLLALTLFGQVKIAAMLTVGWGLSQIVFGSLSGGLLDRRSPSKILAWSMGFQSLTVAALIALFAVDKFFPALLGFPLVTPYSLLALYSLAGGFMGAADTARQVIPPEIVGGKEKALKIFNAKTHMAYEIAGVAGALATGVIIAKFGVISALLLHPPAYLLAAFVFWKLKLTAKAAPQTAPKALGDERAAAFREGGNPLSRAYHDVIEGAKTVFKSPVFRWSTLALVIPLVVHRLLEGLLIPVTAKTLLADPSAAAWIIGASNLGELLGAIFLMRALTSTGDGKTRFRSSFWVRLMAAGSLGVLALNLTTSLWIILPAIGLMSMTWASSDLSLRSKLQNALPKNIRGRAFAFIGATAFTAILTASLGIGFLMDLLPTLAVFYGIDVLLAAAAVLLFFTASRINGSN